MNPDRRRPFGTDLARVSSRRSLLLMAAGALFGLLLAGYSLFTARGTTTLFVPPEDVALVNQQPISRVDYLQQLQALFGVDLRHATREQRKKVLDDMIREELFVQRAKELDVALSDPEVRSAMVNAVELEIAADALTSRPDDAELLAFYHAHEANYASEGIMTVADYVADEASPDALAGAAAALRQAPLPVPSAARTRLAGQGSSAPESLSRFNFRPARTVVTDEYYFAAKVHLGEPLFEAARDMTDGQVAGPVTAPDGVHLLYMVRNRKPIPQAFGSVRDRVLTDYRNAAIARLRSGDESYLRKRANISIADDMR